MSRRVAAHKLPDNPTWIEFPRSDGNSRSWPTNTKKVVTGGEVNYMRPASLEDSVSIHWRVSVGDSVAKALNMKMGGEDSSSMSYIMCILKDPVW